MNDLKLQQKIEDMLPYMDDRLKNFPSDQRFSLTMRIRDAAYELLTLSGIVASRFYTMNTLNSLDREKARLTVLIEYASTRKFISVHQKGVWLEMLAEIGRMIHGLKEDLKNRPTNKPFGNKS